MIDEKQNLIGKYVRCRRLVSATGRVVQEVSGHTRVLVETDDGTKFWTDKVHISSIIDEGNAS